MSAYEQLRHPAVRGGAQLGASAWHVFRWFFARFRVVSKLWTCWHWRMSRPFTRDGETFRVCLRCGVHRRFDLEQWKTKGSYYREDNVAQRVDSQDAAMPAARTKLRLIA